MAVLARSRHSFGAASWRALGVFSAYASLPVALLLLHARSLDLIALGDEPAQHLGADVDRLRRLVYLCTALLTAASVATCGIIGFVGLVVPHLLRPLVAHRPGRLLLVSGLGGAALTLAADISVRLLPIRPELKLGVVTAIIGAPFLFGLIYRLREEEA